MASGQQFRNKGTMVAPGRRNEFPYKQDAVEHFWTKSVERTTKKWHTLINQLSAEQKASCWLYGVLGNYRRYTADTIYIGADKDHDNPDSWVACKLMPTQKGVSDHLFWSKVKCSTPLGHPTANNQHVAIFNGWYTSVPKTIKRD
jgi:hypothetical protein